MVVGGVIQLILCRKNHRGWYENELGRNVKLLQGKLVGDWRDNIFAYPL